LSGVAKFNMPIEWQVCGVERHSASHTELELPCKRANDRRASSPKDAVVNYEKLTVCICGCLDHGISGVDSKPDLANCKFGALDLESVHRHVRELGDLKELV
jgi:hypothetical protein